MHSGSNRLNRLRVSRGTRGKQRNPDAKSDIRTGTQLRAFHNRSVSEETRSAYQRVTAEFFRFVGNRHPDELTGEHLLAWRDSLLRAEMTAATVTFKLAVIRSMFEYLLLAGYVTYNPAVTKLVPIPAIPEHLRGRALTAPEVRYLLSGPDRTTTDGARDYALMLLVVRTSLRISEACKLSSQTIKWTHGRWTVTIKVKGGRERAMPLPADVKAAIDDYIRIDRQRRETLKTNGENYYVFQPHTNYRTLEFNKPLSRAMAWLIIKKGRVRRFCCLTPSSVLRSPAQHLCVLKVRSQYNVDCTHQESPQDK